MRDRGEEGPTVRGQPPESLYGIQPAERVAVAFYNSYDDLRSAEPALGAGDGDEFGERGGIVGFKTRALTLRALKKNNIVNEVVVARGGAEALDYVFGTGAHTGREVNQLPQVVLLDLKLPRVDGLEVLQRIRADPRTKLLPVVVLTSSKEDRDVVESYSRGANSVRKPVDFQEFLEAAKQLRLYWLVLNEPPPGVARAEP